MPTLHLDIGINGAFLALGMARERDLGPLRDLWLENGSLESLLRTPLAKDPPSLLKGDDYFLPKVRAVTAADLQRVAQRYFAVERKNVSILLPAEPATAAAR